MLANEFASPQNQAAFAQDDRARFSSVLAPQIAEGLAKALTAHQDFNWMLAPSGKFSEVSPADMNALSGQEKQTLQHTINRNAQRGEGFLYKGHRLETSQVPAFKDFYAALNSEAVLSEVRKVTGSNEIVSADAQATLYQEGHFLTRHLDDPQDETRLFAYVFSFCRQWHPDWGGLLQFYERDGTPRDAWTPGFNTLSLFSVRHVHSVTYVTPFVGEPRLSITGWFHGK